MRPSAPWCAAADLSEPAPSAGLWINDSNVSLGAVQTSQDVSLERRSLCDGLVRRLELVALTDIRAPCAYPYWMIWPH